MTGARGRSSTATSPSSFGAGTYRRGNRRWPPHRWSLGRSSSSGPAQRPPSRTGAPLESHLTPPRHALPASLPGEVMSSPAVTIPQRSIARDGADDGAYRWLTVDAVTQRFLRAIGEAFETRTLQLWVERDVTPHTLSRATCS